MPRKTICYLGATISEPGTKPILNIGVPGHVPKSREAFRAECKAPVVTMIMCRHLDA